MGSGTTAIAAKRTGRHFVGFELNPDYCAIIAERLAMPEVPAPPPKKPKKPRSTVNS
jgi:site-specific DNA-methyltransferase (adenine-specific)